MTDADAGGLRERKKRATRQAIERGAVELALEHGYENVTVEMICERAMISQRTFFNYAGSKERAVLGVATPLPGPELRAAYLAGEGGSPLEGLVATVSAAFSEFDGQDSTLFQDRRRIVQENPTLAIKEFARMEETQNSIVGLVRERLRADEPSRDERDVDDEARMVVSLTFGIMHYLVRDWIAGGSVRDATDAVAQAVRLARRVAGA